MSLITTYKDYCEIDRLDGVDLANGDRLRLTFPDGSVVDAEIGVAVSSYKSQSGNQSETIRVRKAYIDEVVRGVSTRVYLAGLEAERIV